LVIIEAKTAENLNKNQLEDFVEDKLNLKLMFEGLGIDPPEIKLVILAQSRYFQSPSFSLENGVGRSILDGSNGSVDSLVSWQQLFDGADKEGLLEDDELRSMLERANVVE
jgi:hypothetical protein